MSITRMLAITRFFIFRLLFCRHLAPFRALRRPLTRPPRKRHRSIRIVQSKARTRNVETNPVEPGASGQVERASVAVTPGEVCGKFGALDCPEVFSVR